MSDIITPPGQCQKCSIQEIITNSATHMFTCRYVQQTISGTIIIFFMSLTKCQKVGWTCSDINYATVI